MNLVPIVIEKTNLGERSYDIYSRLLKDRIVIINGCPFLRGNICVSKSHNQDLQFSMVP